MDVTRPHSRRTFLAGAAATGAALAAESLLPSESHAARPAAPVNITYWYPWGSDSKTYEENRAKTFNATHADIHVTGLYVPPHSGVDNGKLLSAIASGNVPDLVVCDIPSAGAVMGYQGGLVDLTPHLKTVGWSPSQMLPGILPLMRYTGGIAGSGKIWALPETGNLMYLYINRTLFRKAGLDPNKPPRNLTELDAMAAKLTTHDSSGKFKTVGFIPWAYEGGGGAGSTGVYTWPWVFGANFTKVVKGKVTLTLSDPAFIRALNWEAGYAKKYGADKLQVVATGTLNPFTPNDLFITGEIAMMVAGNWHTEALRTYNPKLDYAVFPIPYPPGGRANATLFAMNVYMVPAGSKHPLEAVKFASWAGNGSAVIGNENIWRTFAGYKQGPTAPKNIWQQHGDAAYKVTELLSNSPNATNGVLMPISAQLGNDLWAAEQKVIYGQATAEQALSEVQNRLQPILDKALHQ
ncbi:MAG: extracellular solute-binding protein [Chloroflexi bacterium]|nr:extracellular solute-binding protein [Chloroflexota bacterium]